MVSMPSIVVYETTADWQASYEAMVNNSLVQAEPTQKGLLWFKFRDNGTVFQLSPNGKLQVKWNNVSEKKTLFRLLGNLLVTTTGEKPKFTPQKQQTWIPYPVPDSFKLFWCDEETELVTKKKSNEESKILDAGYARRFIETTSYGTGNISGVPPLQEILKSEAQNNTQKDFDLWIKDSKSRWEALVTQKLFAEQPSRYSHGTWTASYSIEADFNPPALASFLNILEKVKGHETGWPAWLIPHGTNTSPYPYNGLIECWIKDGRIGGPAHSDFWRASPAGEMFLLRGYQEDEEPALAGKIFDLILPVWRVGECLLHSERLAKELGITSAQIAFQFSWNGLDNRLLKSWANSSVNHRRMMCGDYRAKQNSVTTNIKVQSDQISANLTEIVSSLTRELYETFDFFEPPPKMIEEELASMRGSKVS